MNRNDKYFEKEKRRLSIILGKNNVICNLNGAKNVEIIIGAKNKNDIINIKLILEEFSYKFLENKNNDEKLFFEKTYGVFFKRKVNILLTTYNSNIWKLFIKNKL